MRYGHFDNEKREYVIDRVDLPTSWTNYLHRHRAAGFQPYQRQQHTQDLFCTGRAHPALRLCGAAQG